MDRQIVYIGQIPQDTDILNSNKDAYIGLAKACAAILGTSTLLNAFTCTQTSPASMQVQVGPGEIYSLQNIDNTAYGSLAPDTTHTIVKQGVILNTTNLTLTAPSTSGFSVNYLIQIGFSEVDTGSTVLPYYNASNPSQAWSGPNNSGTANTTNRSNTVNIQAKQGVAATTGTQVTPSPDTGFVGAFVVTVANGQVTITNANISTYSGAPFITETLTQKISQTTADARYVQFAGLQSGQYTYGLDTSVSPNTVTATLSPAITSYSTGMVVAIKIANTNTGASTINLNGLGSKSITTTAGNALVSADLQANAVALMVYNGTAFELINTAASVDFLPANIQNSSYVYVVDSGAVNAYAATLSPAVTSYSAGLQLFLKIANTNTSTTTTLNVNSLGTKSIKLINGNNPNIGDLASGMIARLIYDGTNFQLLNPVTFASQTGVQNNSYTYVADTGGAANTYAATLSPAVTSYTAGLQVVLKIANTNTGASTLNVNGLGAKTIVSVIGNALGANALVVGQIAIFVYDGTNFQLIDNGQIGKLVSVQTFSSTGVSTYTKPANVSKALAIGTAAGGGGAGGNGSNSGGGGGAGATAIRLITPGSTETVTIGTGGTAGTTGNSGGNGGTTSFGTWISCTGGSGGAMGGGSANGGIASSGDTNLNGGTGGAPQQTDVRGGFGSPSYWGGGGAQGWGGTGGTGNAPGAGGGGGGGNNAGGAGANGYVVVYEYA